MGTRFTGTGIVTVTLDNGAVYRAQLREMTVHQDTQSFEDVYGTPVHVVTRAPSVTIEALGFQMVGQHPLPAPPLPTPTPETFEKESPEWGTW